jgi:UDP-2,3-diacylglucosamine pyrophosphatase LpxH
MYLDRIAVTVALIGLILLTAVFLLSSEHSLALLVAATMAAASLLTLLMCRPQRRNQYRHRDRRECRDGALALVRQKAKIVVLGHTHHPDTWVEPLGVYLNPGAFHLPTPLGHPFVIVQEGQAQIDFSAKK